MKGLCIFVNEAMKKNLKPIKKSDLKFRKVEEEDDDYPRPGAPKLHCYIGPDVEYYIDEDTMYNWKAYKKGEILSTNICITEYYNDRLTGVGGYEARFGDNNIIGTYPTFDKAVDALVRYANIMRTPNHDKPKWIYNQSRGEYQDYYKF